MWGNAMRIAAIEPLTRVARTPGASGTILGFRRARPVCEYQFETAEEIAKDLIGRAGSLLALRWQACFVRQFDSGRWDDSEFRLVSVVGDVPLRVMQLRPRTLCEVRILDATIIPIDHAGRLSGIWLLGAQRHGAHLGPAQVGQVAELVRPAAAAF